ncbi:MAG TPA: polysaccharide export protein EpsE [Povalibacter sp.]|nr:polysaccharide export protein EpsE [Povalibacter sp.]
MNWQALIAASLCLWLALGQRVDAAIATDQDYKLGAGDLVRMNVFGSPELMTEARVSQSGSITCPLIGSVPVAGMSTAEVETLLARRYVDGGFLKQPQISVLVVEFQSQKISVLGHVGKPGQYPLRASSNVLDVLAEAGGLLAQSAGDVATITHANGSKQEVDLPKLFDGDPEQNVTVGGGDRIYVPKAPQFYVYGQVQKPGMYKLERHMTVSRAISAAGGLTAKGTERRAIVKRRDANGKEKEYSAGGTDMLQPDDILFIKESLF